MDKCFSVDSWKFLRKIKGKRTISINYMLTHTLLNLYSCTYLEGGGDHYFSFSPLLPYFSLSCPLLSFPPNLPSLPFLPAHPLTFPLLSLLFYFYFFWISRVWAFDLLGDHAAAFAGFVGSFCRFWVPAFDSCVFWV